MTGSEVEKGKPAPDIYLSVAAQLGVPVHRCLVFEDIIPGSRSLFCLSNAPITP